VLADIQIRRARNSQERNGGLEYLSRPGTHDRDEDKWRVGDPTPERRGHGPCHPDPMTLLELQSRLNGLGVSDILVPGFVDQDEQPVRFRSLPHVVYFECGSVYMKMEIISTTGLMRITISDKLDMPIGIEEDMTAAVTSLREQCLDDVDSENGLDSIRFWGLLEEENGLRCAAAQLDLVSGQQIFVDPSYHFGIRIGGPRQKEIWRENWPAAEQASERIVGLIAG
jgi:hypothetical protein